VIENNATDGTHLVAPCVRAALRASAYKSNLVDAKMPMADVNGYDFHLTSGSGALIDAGSSTHAPTIDHDGRARTSPPDIGAFEYAP
jgi:hypothetical protein